MNYRHAYHAGNFADVFKHCLLVALLEALKAKATPFCVIDTHAGAGRYDLSDERAQRTKEFHGGIARLGSALDLPAIAHTYLNLVRALNAPLGGSWQVYPGSPLLCASLMRDQDRLVLCELQDEETLQLRREFRHDARVHVHQRSGWEALGALLPPAEKRGLVFIDPPYEQSTELEQAMQALDLALQRWPAGVYALWYPIKLRSSLGPLQRWLSRCAARRAMVAELCLYPEDSALRLNGCGLAILNAPWRFDTTAEHVAAALHRQLADGRCGRHGVQRIRCDDA